MDFITGKHLPRRTFLRGMGATVALPFLDAMVPAGSLWSNTAKEIDKPRLIAIEMVHGAAGSNDWGREQHLWSPAQVGRNFDLAGTSLDSLEPFRDYLTIVSNTNVKMAEAFQPKEIGGDHFRSSAVYLTQMHPKQTEGSDVFVGKSLDQYFADKAGAETAIPSMQLCIEPVDQSGGCAYGYACVYTDTISWKTSTEPLPMIRDPRVAFDQIFGAGGTPADRAQRRRTNKSILDWVAGEVADLQRQLGPSDRQRMDRYLQNVREVEQRIQRIEAKNSSGAPRELPGAPAGVPDDFGEHVHLMMDIQVLAFQSDMTRVFSFKMSRDGTARVYPESGVDKAFHPASHHGGNEQNIMDFAQINRYHVSMVPYLLGKLKESEEGDANLLDKTLVMYGSPMGDPNIHNHNKCPLFLAGRANGQLQGGMHLKAPEGTPMANVQLSLLHKLGRDDLDSFGDSTAEFSFGAPSVAETAQAGA